MISGIMQPLFLAFLSAIVLEACTVFFSNIIYLSLISLRYRYRARSCKIGLFDGAEET